MTEKKIKIALFSEVLKENLDGVTNTLYNIIEKIPAEKFEYLFITSYAPSAHIKLPFRTITVPKIAFPTNEEYPISIPFFNKELKKALEEFRPDLIHVTTPFTLGAYALNYGKKKNIPVLATYHTHFISYIEYYFKYFPIFSWILNKGGWKYLNWFYNQCERIYVPTTSIIEELLENGIENKRMMLWGRGVNNALFNPSKKDAAYMDNLCGKDTKRILFVSRLVWEKELKTLVGIYNIFKKDRPDIKMVITGNGPRKEKLQKLMPNAVFTGKLIKEDLARIYASSDVFVFPSITETFGNVVLEAMACGIPCVIAAKGGPKGIVKDGITGYHAEPKNYADFSNKLLKLLDDLKLRKEMSENAAAYALTQKWDILCGDMFKSYETLLPEKAIKNTSEANAAII